jgi:tRNA threonylcarbamoyladenosine biosynthesis protein TsaB
MKLLAFDTATDVCTAALWLDGQVLERSERESRHSEHLLPMVNALLTEAGMRLQQLDAIAFGRGPGSFTGLRIGAGIAQGLAFGAGLPVVPVSSLAALAQGIDAEMVLAAFDARMRQVYWGEYVRSADGLMTLQGIEQVLAPQSVPQPEGEGWVGAGSGWDAYSAALQARVGQSLNTWQAGCCPRAGDLARLAADDFLHGRAVPAEQALPVYVRDDVAVKAKTAK